MSWAEFLAAGEEWQRWELVDGEVQFVSPTGHEHAAVISNLILQLGTYCKQHREWISLASEAAFTMASDNWRCPDAALVGAERYPARKIQVAPGTFPPDVAFEVYSPGDTASQIGLERRDYQESGVIQVWIDPERRSAELIEPGRPPRYFDGDHPLVIDRLTGFTLDLKALLKCSLYS